MLGISPCFLYNLGLKDRKCFTSHHWQMEGKITLGYKEKYAFLKYFSKGRVYPLPGFRNLTVMFAFRNRNRPFNIKYGWSWFRNLLGCETYQYYEWREPISHICSSEIFHFRCWQTIFARINHSDFLHQPQCDWVTNKVRSTCRKRAEQRQIKLDIQSNFLIKSELIAISLW